MPSSSAQSSPLPLHLRCRSLNITSSLQNHLGPLGRQLIRLLQWLRYYLRQSLGLVKQRSTLRRPLLRAAKDTTDIRFSDNGRILGHDMRVARMTIEMTLEINSQGFGQEIAFREQSCMIVNRPC